MADRLFSYPPGLCIVCKAEPTLIELPRRLRSPPEAKPEKGQFLPCSL